VKIKARLLIADDADIVRRAVLGIVADLCHGVEVVGEVKNHDELFAMASAVKPHIVLMDLNMPCEDPLDAEVLKAHLTSACLLAMSAWFDEPSKERARKCGAVELLDKATLAKTLQPAIDRCMAPLWTAAGQQT
jgi:DNA-binding NarL/FixJ family response regulator